MTINHIYLFIFIVRVGGGYILFVEYLKKHAGVENVRFKRDGMKFSKVCLSLIVIIFIICF